MRSRLSLLVAGLLLFVCIERSAFADPPSAPPPPAPVVKEDPPSRTVPIIVTSLGAVAIVSAVVMYSTSGPSGNDRTYVDLRTPSYYLAGAGAITIGVGAYLWWRASHSERSAPVAAVTRDGAVFGWFTRF